MVFKLAHSRIFGLVMGLAAATAATATAQDTASQERTGDQEDSAQVQNPPGYRGMERDTTQVPPGTFKDDSLEAGRVEDKATGTYDDSAWQDTTKGRQNPAGYRGMERPVGGDTSAAGDTAAADTSSADTTGGDTTAVGETESRTPEQPEARPPTARDTTGHGGESADTSAPE